MIEPAADAAAAAICGGFVIIVGRRIHFWSDFRNVLEDMAHWLSSRLDRKPKRLTPAQFEALLADNMRDPREWIREAEEAFDTEQLRLRNNRVIAATSSMRRHGRGWTTGSGPAPTKPPPPAHPVKVHRFDHSTGRETIREEMR